MNFKRILFLSGISGIILNLGLAGCGGRRDTPITRDTMRDEVLMYLAQPTFGGRELEKQVLGNAHFELIDLDSMQVYISIPDSLAVDGKREKAIAGFALDPKRIVQAKEEGGLLKIGETSWVHGGKRGMIFRCPVDNIRIDTAAMLSFPFERGTYRVSVAELAALGGNKNIYGGHLDAYMDNAEHGRPVVIANHGAFVATPAEPSMKRFVAEVTKGIGPGDPLMREDRIQALLNVVTNEIAYDDVEASNDYETLKRPNEVLMSRTSDCSNKTILFASLMEQLGEDYLLVYWEHHISVAVLKGKFPEGNGDAFQWDDKSWVVAETTAKDFRIGQDRLTKDFTFDRIYYVQRPSVPDQIINPHTGKVLVFR
ncbi:MAG: hypothetical protein JWQ98_1237 [Chlorobi bacterium]|nr:hypothetical protein [Chlorobiota bacterium]